MVTKRRYALRRNLPQIGFRRFARLFTARSAATQLGELTEPTQCIVRHYLQETPERTAERSFAARGKEVDASAASAQQPPGAIPLKFNVLEGRIR